MNDEVRIVRYNGSLVVNGRQVAKNFEKLHKDVIKIICNILFKMNITEEARDWFVMRRCKNKNEETDTEYLINGFSLLVMEFTGKKVLLWNIRYIKAFDLVYNEIFMTKIIKYYSSSGALKSFIIPIKEFGQISQSRSIGWMEYHKENKFFCDKVISPIVKYCWSGR